MSVLVIDVGTSGLRAAIVHPDATIHHLHARRRPPESPFPGMVEFDATALAAAAMEAARAALDEFDQPVTAVGISAQRASTVVWDRATGEPVGPAIGWQDLRTVFDCITLKADLGLALAPNQSATKLRWLLEQHDAGRTRDLCFGTVDTWLAWHLSGGALHVTDHTNAAVTGLLTPDATAWSSRACAALGVPDTMLPALVNSSGLIGSATALPGAPPIAAMVGDQQASLIGQSCVSPGATKITFGTGGMLDTCTGAPAPHAAARSADGTFPIVAWSRRGDLVWGIEAIMLSAGTNVEWLVDDLNILAAPADSHAVAAACDHTGGVVYVPALMGLGTPHWDFGARGSLFGLTRGTARPEIVRAVLEGVAHRGADLIDAARADLGSPIHTVRVDGGMTANPTFLQAVADASGCVVEVARYSDSTTLGAGFLAGLAVGDWAGMDDIAAAWSPSRVVVPARSLDREQWSAAVARARRWIPDLSALDF